MTDAIRALRADRTALLEICSGLREDDWQADSGCAGWTIKDIVAHLGAAVLVGRRTVRPPRHRWPADRNGWGTPGSRPQIPQCCDVLDDYAAVSDKALIALQGLVGAGLRNSTRRSRRLPCPTHPHRVLLRPLHPHPSRPVPAQGAALRRETSRGQAPPRTHPRLDRSRPTPTEPISCSGPVRTRRDRDKRQGGANNPARTRRAGGSLRGLGCRRMRALDYPPRELGSIGRGISGDEDLLTDVRRLKVF